MKTRSDFVSNSSSSSFVVIDEDGTDEIFKQDRMTFDEMIARHFDICSGGACIELVEYGQIRRRSDVPEIPEFEVIDDSEFGARYERMDVPAFSVLKSHAFLVPTLTKLILKYMRLSNLPEPRFLTDGERDGKMSLRWSKAKWNALGEISDEFDEKAKPMREKMIELVRERMGGLMFWEAELGDECGLEQKGYAKSAELRWRITRNHH